MRRNRELLSRVLTEQTRAEKQRDRAAERDRKADNFDRAASETLHAAIVWRTSTGVEHAAAVVTLAHAVDRLVLEIARQR